MKISEYGEINLIKKINRNIRLFSKDIVKGIGDDTAVLKFDKKHFLLLTTDTLVEDDHFNLSWFSAEQIGNKAIESNVSDIAAMGGFPKYALISLTIPKDTNINFIYKLYNGINKKCKKYKINLRKFKILHFDFDDAINSSTIFRSLKEFGNLIDMGDIMIAGICIINDITLLTRNKKHFERVTNFGLKLV